ncbi:phosphoribosylaminoimidazolesuccinocarboxamide synthase [Belliella kenyensis]|uniref:Phosphoribosylaminoimidazole-succinocarboxamide synthase n=1 Tax=Belliella kenyensis TaxID=1472724 RepID=A0ABV8EJV1_9BACT|nr:phosphoribosylaminoimidazolesuccinocarboxamide synthase [Belliella kenyensis]MCH7400286.1 phosphoribosylaminoimidazolesuccinocarboxamide synthase [Belliella kenyensis]MDN3604696.1 phosphoribosylaminoimidazolesuccinocarboxamide synthase [Belliella kenyensis]MDN3605266.1 phosphoribosylaminoimidazolesuccinocarboxamide synthase [Belliella kenyensis]
MKGAIKETKFRFPNQIGFYKGKVRDVYKFEKSIVVIATDRISAFDVVLPKPIPYKGQVLNQIAAKFLEATSDIVPNWVTSHPDPNVTMGKKCEPFKVEMVIRGYLAGHAAREYAAGKRTICGVALPDGLKENDKLPHPIITPTTKADEGHDEDISKESILAKGIVSHDDYQILEKYTHALYARGTEIAAEKGLILVDTKYEFGKYDGEIYLIDEIHTPDSSRYFYADRYEANQAAGLPQKQLSKEFVRQWLISNGFQGKEGQQVPDMPPAFVQEISDRYIELFEKITGETFVKAETLEIEKRIEKAVLDHLM